MDKATAFTIALVSLAQAVQKLPTQDDLSLSQRTVTDGPKMPQSLPSNEMITSQPISMPLPDIPQNGGSLTPEPESPHKFDSNSSLDKLADYGIDVSGSGASSAADLIERSDENSQPICYMGGLEEVIDPSWPVDECCRVYADVLFRGRFQDFCNWAKAGEEIKHQKLTGIYGYDAWENEISSFKCGNLVGIKLFRDYEHDDLMDEGGAGSMNWKLENNDNAKGLRIIKYSKDDDPNPEPASGTIYSKKGCHGRSFIVGMEKDETGFSYNDSGEMYKRPSTWNTEKDGNDWEPQSVWLQNGFELEAYFDAAFGDDSYTIRRKKDAELVRGRRGQCYNYIDEIPSVLEASPNGQGWKIESLSYRKYKDPMDI